MPRQISISDLHGCADTFLHMLDRLAYTKADELYLLGDYVDRGPRSKSVIDLIWQLQAEGYQVHCLKGNHEAMTVDDYISEKYKGRHNTGDANLLASFKVSRIVDVPEAYIQWMDKLPLYHEVPGFILVHAGLDFTREDKFANQEALMWIRDWHQTIQHEWLGDRIIVHGHTPQPPAAIRTQFMLMDTRRWLDIDAGCALRHPMYQELCAFDMTNRQLHFEQCIDYL
ncbi:MAG: serine/threonine protein phosphatase [Chitinophagales bacterium]|nr:serine/threonine protein phosphatase [Chitinophagales bacterium]